jgi:tRNA (guanine-N7-)-methyltransferase
MSEHKRQIRSFVKRAGRMTPAQQRGMDQGFGRYGRTCEQGRLGPQASFNRAADWVLEIGFGMGHAFLQQVKAHPEAGFIGVEVHTPGVGSVLNAALDSEVENLLVYCEDANEVLDKAIPDGSLTKLQLFFPDPWPKKRHHKRRLLNPPFIDRLLPKLKPGGVLHLATDWVPYAEHMQEVMQQYPQFHHLAAEGVIYPRHSTRFERRGEGLGHEITDLVYRLG